MSIEVFECSVCHRFLPNKLRSSADESICVECIGKMLARTQTLDGTWYETGLQMGIKPWEQFPNEPRSAFVLFKIYIDAYPKELSLKELSEQSTYGITAVRHWNTRWRWKQRYLEYARYYDNKMFVEQIDKRKELNAAQYDAAAVVFANAMARIASIDMDELTPNETLAWAKYGSDLQRQAIKDQEQILAKELENRQYNTGIEGKKNKSAQDDKLSEVLKILSDAGAINIESTTTATVSSPKLVQGDCEIVEDAKIVE